MLLSSCTLQKTPTSILHCINGSEKSMTQFGPQKDKSTCTHQFEQRCYRLKSCFIMFMSLSGPDPFVSKSGVQMVKEGNIILSSLKKRYTEPRSWRESLFHQYLCGPAEVSIGPRLPAYPSGHRGGLISSSHGEALWP